ncbi:MAG: hypothetical protein IKG18_15905 [Atopobiaceae bacterium]|nr:hypothetical protein [Atopobiaceae bacterium]MBR3315610.1 hypothetical protein [Atopobiaceae bacterium]
MVGRDEELVQGWRLLAALGYDVNDSAGLMGPASPQSLIEVISRAGVANASAHVAKTFAFKDLALIADLHADNQRGATTRLIWLGARVRLTFC